MTKISQLTDIGANLAANDEFIIRDVSDASTPNKKVTSSGFIDYIVAQGTGAGFTQIAAGVGPLARVRTISSGTTGTILFETANGGSIAERARCDPAGRFLAGLTSANTSGAKLQTSDGLTFPATQVASADPNTLDDYEEGTWTPNQGAGLTVTGTFSSAGTYVKTGNLVYVRGTMSATTMSASAGGVVSTNLPFVNAANSGGGNITNADGNAGTTVYVSGALSRFIAAGAVTNGGGGLVFGFTYSAQ
tara:strand:- start:1780 stop:2523 length:744 start_codon:yes stop_codon:yes gene_type:complete